MNYTERFKAISTLTDLYAFRDELLKDADDNSSTKSGGIDFDKLRDCQNANFYLHQVENRIDYLGKEGVWLDSIPIPETSKQNNSLTIQ